MFKFAEMDVRVMVGLKDKWEISRACFIITELYDMTLKRNVATRV